MATYEKVKLSGLPTGNLPTNFGPVGALAIHTTGSSSTIFDELWVWVSNNSTQDNDVSINVGGEKVREIVPAKTTMLFLSGIPISGDGSVGTQIDAVDELGNANPLIVFGYVNRITP